ncbi:type II toxin-antitoxin system VapC family toxin [Brucella oryzae]|uniref:type II toxin-antitoxin system VapC family toxin n=1 Tax=Brucella oryzae TaxID=335286 RepID=UPI001B843535|nr:type II toxin-antitoxin system VapC family toxin [Brucella oryzae]MBR7653363.1 type II toxin-antitoxin system VapC family toxin [Brucella oryzae]
MTTFVDTNILLCMSNPNEEHHQWAIDEFIKCKEAGPTVICDIVYSEFSVGMKNKSDVDTAISAFSVDRLPYTDDALFNAGKVFQIYRHKHKGQKTNVLPDFMIGAIASFHGIPLMTLNKKDYTKYFPALKIICPTK